jgi:dihydropteroate synthase
MSIAASRPSPGTLPIVGNPALPRGFLSAGEAVERRLYVNPLNAEADEGRPSRCEVLFRYPDRIEVAVGSVDGLRRWALGEGEDVAVHVVGLVERWFNPCRKFAGLDLVKPMIMGIVNVTPDSFSDGGDFAKAEDAVAQGLKLRTEGADIIDVGGESTRPGATAVAADEELDRVLPVVRGLVKEGVVVSIDSRHAAVMKAALQEGARIVNDVTALEGEKASMGVATKAEAGVVLMHMQGEPGTMNQAPRYEAAALDVFDYLQGRVSACMAAGIEAGELAVDPGLGFGKSPAHNREILSRLGLYRGLGLPILIGASRKIGRLLPGQTPTDRVGGSLAAALSSIARGASIVRVHDVAATRQALEVWREVAG